MFTDLNSDKFSIAAIANQLLRKMALRRVDARSLEKLPLIEKCEIHKDGNFTFVVLKTTDGYEYTGSAKFNPADIRKLKLKKRNGQVAFRFESKYNERAGESRALHRALEKILF